MRGDVLLEFPVGHLEIIADHLDQLVKRGPALALFEMVPQFRGHRVFDIQKHPASGVKVERTEAEAFQTAFG